jgi:hypothetical protein
MVGSNGQGSRERERAWSVDWFYVEREIVRGNFRSFKTSMVILIGTTRRDYLIASPLS